MYIYIYLFIYLYVDNCFYSSFCHSFYIEKNFLLKIFKQFQHPPNGTVVKKKLLQSRCDFSGKCNISQPPRYRNEEHSRHVDETARDFDGAKEPTSRIFSAHSPVRPCAFVNGRQSSVMRIRLVVQLTAVYERLRFISPHTGLHSFVRSCATPPLCPSLFLCERNVETRTAPCSDSFIIPFTAKST